VSFIARDTFYHDTRDKEERQGVLDQSQANR